MRQIIVLMPVYVIASIALPLGIWEGVQPGKRRVDVFLLDRLNAYRDGGCWGLEKRVRFEGGITECSAQGQERVITKKSRNVAK